MTELAGTPYRLVRRIGAGAAGEVFEAVHVALEQKRAIKLLSLQNMGRPEVIERMKVEAQTLATLRHKNLVEVVDLGVASDGRIWFAMELLEGTSLRKNIVANKHLRADVAVELAIELTEGLAVAHAAGVVHRDVKPENVFVCSSGAVKVLDFGTAKVAFAAAHLTRSGFSVGTLQYMAPEQIEGKGVDARTDLYAVGLVLFEMITGKPPFEDRDNVSLAFAHVTRPPPTMSEKLGAPVDPELERVVARLLAKEKSERFQTADELTVSLKACLSALRAPPPAPAAKETKGQTARMSTVPTGSPASGPGHTLMIPRRDETPTVPPPAPKRERPLAVLLTVGTAVIIVAILLGAIAIRSLRAAPAPAPAPTPTPSLTPTPAPTPTLTPTPTPTLTPTLATAATTSTTSAGADTLDAGKPATKRAVVAPKGSDTPLKLPGSGL